MVGISLRTTDLGEAEAMMRERYAMRIDSPPADIAFDYSFTADPLGGVTLIRARSAMRFSFAVTEPTEETTIAHVRQGALACRAGRGDNRWATGDVCVSILAGAMGEMTQEDCEVHSVAISPSGFDAVARTAGPGPVALTGNAPVSAEAAATWLATLDYAQHAAVEPELSPLVAGATARLLAATALATFPSNAQLDPTSQDRRDAHPITVRRAISFMESHPDQDLSVADVARAASVTPRALQLAFQQHVGTTPMRYLRRVRLDRAHADLQAGDPAVETVTAVAARWGWASPSRFAADYRVAHGRHPHQTLRG